MSTPTQIENTKMAARQRRAQRRLEKRKAIEEREALLKSLAERKLAVQPPRLRQSVFANHYPESTEMDWIYIENIGWYHKHEEFDFKNTFKQCSVRGTWHTSSAMVQTYLGDLICGEEANANWEICALSGHAYKKGTLVKMYWGGDETRQVAPEYLRSHGRKCDVTGRIYHRNQVVAISGNSQYKTVSKGRLSGMFVMCNRCERYFATAEAPRRNDSGAHECNSCYEIRIIGEVIHAHNYNKYPAAKSSAVTVRRCAGGEEKKDAHGFPFFDGKRSNRAINVAEKRLFGVEAETEIYRKGAEKDGLNRFLLANNVIKALGNDFVIVKEDGTLTANEHYSKRTGYAGFEIVSCPASLEVHRSLWPKLQEAVGFKHLRAWDEYDTCGFHVHVSRESLTYLQVGRMLMFINHKNNAKFIHRVAGRGSDRFCKYIPKEPGDKSHPASDVLYPQERVISKQEEDRRNRSRRVALNLANAKTVEFRIFRGTVHPRHILRNIEFCDAVCDYCYPCNHSFADMANFKVFISFVNKNRKRWPLLAEWLAHQEFINIKKVKDQKKVQKDKLTLKIDEVVEPVVSTTRPAQREEQDTF